MLKNHCDVVLPGLSCQVGQEAVAAVKSLLATEGQSISVMEEEAAFELLFLTVKEERNLKDFWERENALVRSSQFHSEY